MIEINSVCQSTVSGLIGQTPALGIQGLTGDTCAAWQVYSGGIGSYALLVMVASFLLTHHSRASRYVDKHMQPGALEESLGVLLVDFFRFYGRTLNITDVGVSCRYAGAQIISRFLPRPPIFSRRMLTMGKCGTSLANIMVVKS